MPDNYAGDLNMSSENMVKEEYVVNLKALENAKIIYDSVADSLHIIIDEGEADKALLLENDIVVRIRGNNIIELIIQGISRFVRE